MGCHLPAAVDERVHRAELVEDRRGVDDGDEVVEARDVVEARAGGRVLEGEGLGDGEGLRDARRLDEHVVEISAKFGAGAPERPVFGAGTAAAAAGVVE